MDKIMLVKYDERKFISAYRVFYSIGLILFILPVTRPFFVWVTAPSLVIIIGSIFLFHRCWNKKTIYWFAFIYLSSLGVEIYGVNTREIFGSYAYERALDLQIKGVPLVIGLNWLFLVYASHAVSISLFKSGIQRVIIGALLMIAYDLILEGAAPYMSMWHFYTTYPPLSNFIAWFVLALIYHTGFEIWNINVNNKPARWLFAIHIIFFLILVSYSLIFLR